MFNALVSTTPSAAFVPASVAAPNPKTMNTHVYAIERGERRALPQMPCPDVHPLPRLLPTPTRKPASAACASGTMGS